MSVKSGMLMARAEKVPRYHGTEENRFGLESNNVYYPS